MPFLYFSALSTPKGLFQGVPSNCARASALLMVRERKEGSSFRLPCGKTVSISTQVFLLLFSQPTFTTGRVEGWKGMTRAVVDYSCIKFTIPSE